MDSGQEGGEDGQTCYDAVKFPLELAVQFLGRSAVKFE